MNDSQKKLKNIEGKRLLMQNKLDYIATIIQELNGKPEVMEILIEAMETNEDHFFDTLLDNKNTNITFYEEALHLTRKLKNKNEPNK